MDNINWTKKEIKILKTKFKDHSGEEISKIINRRPEAIKKKGQRLKLKKIKRCILAYKLRNLKKRKFKKSSFGYFICGFVAGEGSFVICKTKNNNKKFTFSIILADDDTNILREINKYFGVGKVRNYPKRRENEKGSAHYSVMSIPEIVTVIIPFFDNFDFFSSRKKKQYLKWRKEVLEYIKEIKMRR